MRAADIMQPPDVCNEDGIGLRARNIIRGERQLIECIKYNMLFRGFVGLGAEDEVWNQSIFSKVETCYRTTRSSPHYLRRYFRWCASSRLLSEKHFSVDGTLIKVWAPHKIFRSRDDDIGVAVG